MSASQIRVRFAPSPTGPLHLGGIRTALYNYLFARNQHGKFILRIEDTDQSRCVPRAETYITEALKWCGLQPDEDVATGGPFASYKQSERNDIYRDYVQVLLDRDHAYYAFDTPEALDAIRKEFLKAGKGQFQYNAQTRKQLINSLSLRVDDVTARLDRGDPYVVRILIPEDETIIFNDLIRGEVSVLSANLDDKVLFKSDGLPTYHLANVVDDYLMKISHVIRGEEWLPSAPLHLLLYRFLGWENEMPQFAHLPLILKPDGKGKLSKRDGDKMGFPVFPLLWTDPETGEVSPGYREEGYFPETFINMLALLGWHPDTAQEIFSMDELIAQFSLDRISKSGAKFDPEKARWFNHQYMQRKTDQELAGLLATYLEANTELSSGQLEGHGKSYMEKVIALTKDRATLIPDLWTNSWFFFKAPVTYDEQVIQKMWNPETREIVEGFVAEAKLLSNWTKETFFQLVKNYTSETGLKMGQLMNPLRLFVVGSNQGPGMMDIAGLLGKSEFLSRIESGLLKFT